MTPEEQERLDAISDALARLVHRQAEIESRLARLERHAGVGEFSPGREAARVDLPRPAHHRIAEQTITASQAAPVEAAPPASATAAAPQASQGRDLETAFGLTWISRIAVVTVVLALAFFFEYAFENHWITESGRILLGLACGAAALFFGERFWKAGQRSYGQALTAAGIGFVYLSFWASYALYHLLGQPAAFGLMVLATAGAGALAARYDSVAVAILALAGGFATPLLLTPIPNPPFVLGYVLILNAGAAFAARARGWRAPEAVALAGTFVLYLQLPDPVSRQWTYTLFIILYYALFAASRTLPAMATAQVLAGFALAAIWAPGPAGVWLALLLAAAGLALAEWRQWPVAAMASFAGFWLAYVEWAAVAGSGRPAGVGLALLTASYLLFLAWPAWCVYRGRSLGIQELLIAALNAGLYFGAGYEVLRSGWSQFEGLFAVVIAVAQMGAARLLWRHDRRGSLLAAGAAWVLLVLAVPIQFAGYRVTIVWALEGAALVWMGARLRDDRPGIAGFLVFLLVIVRLAVSDSFLYVETSAYDLLLNARFLAFAVSAAALWAAAKWAGPRGLALAAYVSGHAVMLWGLGLEAVGWAARTAAPESFRNVATTSISVLAAFYAVLLVAGGSVWQSAITRVLGIGLIGLVVVKLYLYDVWLLGEFYRMAAFAILGVLLLAMSYLYSRFRERISQAIRLPRR